MIHVAAPRSERWCIVEGDCRHVLGELAEQSVDAVVCDPPYELAFMGKRWDASGIAYDVSLWREVLRVARPGAHLLAFGGTRTYHRMACAMEDAGWEIRDSIDWIYASGFPKSWDVSAARNGWGTALKPAHEPVVVARKPLVGAVAANVCEHGTGAINVDGCRVDAGRWPPNVLLTHAAECADRCVDGCPVRELDKQSGERPGMASGGKHRDSYPGGMFGATDCEHTTYADTGGASRFFPIFRFAAKASRAERERGCERLPATTRADVTGREEDSPGLAHPRSGVRRAGEIRNHHVAVKPVALMRWLCRLVTPPDGIVLDPFAGSGSTGLGAILEGFRFFGIEQESGYANIARARLRHCTGDGERPSNEVEEPLQGELF